MPAPLHSLLSIVLIASLFAASLLAMNRKVLPERTDFGRRFAYFFVRCLVTIGFWSTLVWWLSDSGLFSRPP